MLVRYYMLFKMFFQTFFIFICISITATQIHYFISVHLNYCKGDKSNTFDLLKNRQCFLSSYMLKNTPGTVQGSSERLQVIFLPFQPSFMLLLSFSLLHKSSCLNYGPQMLFLHRCFYTLFIDHEINSPSLIFTDPAYAIYKAIIHHLVYKSSKHIYPIINDFTIQLDGDIDIYKYGRDHLSYYNVCDIISL